MTDIFKTPFNSYVCPGDTITAEHDGFTFTAHIEDDMDHYAPWENEDGHGPVSEWTTRDKRVGELVLMQDGRYYRYYDYAQACKIAERDGWGYLPGQLVVLKNSGGKYHSWCDMGNYELLYNTGNYDNADKAITGVYAQHRATMTPTQYAAAAAMRDYENLKAWCDDEWSHVGITITASKNGITLCDKYQAALWGIDANYPNSDNSHFLEIANELALEALTIAQDALEALCDC